MKYILVASNGTEMDTSVYTTELDAQTALQNATSNWINKDTDMEDLDCSWVGESSAYLCPIDTNIGEDWYWEIITVDETSDAIKYLLDELDANKKLTGKENDHDTVLVAKARIITILNVLEKLGYNISEN